MNLLFKKSTVLISLAACILMTIVMRIQGTPLQTSTAPKGIVSLEFAYTEPEASLIKNEWGNMHIGNRTVLQVALCNILIDFIYIGTYGLFLILLSLRSAAILKHKKAMRTAAAMAFIAGALDMLENFGMFYTLQKKATPVITILTSIAATIKFSVLLLVILLVWFCWIKSAIQKNNGYN